MKSNAIPSSPQNFVIALHDTLRVEIPEADYP
jgi:hypothetical protein